jgi:hypothetical protein
VNGFIRADNSATRACAVRQARDLLIVSFLCAKHRLWGW